MLLPEQLRDDIRRPRVQGLVVRFGPRRTDVRLLSLFI